MIITMPDGYSGRRRKCRIELNGNHVVAVHKHGKHIFAPCPTASGMDELEWMINNHPNCKRVRIIKKG